MEARSEQNPTSIDLPELSMSYKSGVRILALITNVLKFVRPVDNDM